MTLNEFFQIQGRTYRRAREWQVTFNKFADVAGSVGCKKEAAEFRVIGERAWDIAEKVVDMAFAKVV